MRSLFIYGLGVLSLALFGCPGDKEGGSIAKLSTPAESDTFAQVRVRILGRPQGGTLTLHGRGGLTKPITVTTRAEDTPQTIAARLASAIEAHRQTTESAGNTATQTIVEVGQLGFGLLHQNDDSLVFEGGPGDLYLTTTDPGIDLPPRPTGLRAELRGETIALSWQSVAGATRYYVTRDGVGVGVAVEPRIEDTLGGGAARFDPGLEHRAALTYEVMAIRSDDVVSAPSAALLVTNPIQAPR